MKYVVIDDRTYSLETVEQIEEAEQALRDAGHTSAAVYVGDPECPDSYRTREMLNVCPEED